ncbi:Carboxypeptidase regulatory-like domain-containing protein [Candidatus Methanophagaceae archaeon]|nr:Carboxypeptidase regulatory-like domain-containing protein [Methanophagales archaeon]
MKKKIGLSNRKMQIIITLFILVVLAPSLVFAAVQYVTVLPAPAIITGQITYSNNNTGIFNVSVNLTNATTMNVVNSTTTNGTGYYNFTNVIAGDYYVNATKTRYWDNSTEVNATATEIANLSLWLVGDLNNKGKSADAGDLVLMNRAVLWEISGDWRWDLNHNGRIADAGDLVLMNRAVLHEIILT